MPAPTIEVERHTVRKSRRILLIGLCVQLFVACVSAFTLGAHGISPHAPTFLFPYFMACYFYWRFYHAERHVAAKLQAQIQSEQIRFDFQSQPTCVTTEAQEPSPILSINNLIPQFNKPPSKVKQLLLRKDPLQTVKDAGLRVERHDWFRCTNCGKMQSDNIVWIADDTRADDPLESVVKRSRANNGGSSGWCVQCAARLTNNK